MSDEVEVELSVNGQRHQVRIEPRKSLVDTLRQDCFLTGTHVGCEIGVCGACTVLVDGKAVRSCLMFACQANGRSITTIEGLANPDGTLHPVQEAFQRARALQCGFCTPGFVMSVLALTERTVRPTRDEVRDALAGNLCRCTGYQTVIKAVDPLFQLDEDQA